MLEGLEKKKSSSPGKTRSDAASDSARNRKGGIKYRKSSNTTVGLINYCLAMVSMMVAAVGFYDDSKRPRVKGTINGAAVQFLVDSGASVSVVSERTIDGKWGAAELRRLPMPRHLRVAGVTGEDIQVVDYVEAEMTILGRTKTRPILVVKGLLTTEAILGYNFIKQEGLVVDGARNEVYFSKEVPHAAAWSIATLRASKEMTLEPRSVHKVQANPFVGRQMLQPNLEGICASLDTDVGIWDAVARSDKDGQVTVAVVNITDKTYQVHKGDVIGSFRNPEQSGDELVLLDDKVVASIFGEIGKDPKEPERGQTESINPKQAKELEAQLQIHATGSIRARYRELIMQYHDVIFKDKYDLGRASVIKHKIKMRDGQPLHARQFRIPFPHKETIFDYVDELLRRGAIEVSRSPYNSPIFCVAGCP
jgi:hypothetical protein